MFAFAFRCLLVPIASVNVTIDALDPEGTVGIGGSRQFEAFPVGSAIRGEAVRGEHHLLPERRVAFAEDLDRRLEVAQRAEEGPQRDALHGQLRSQIRLDDRVSAADLAIARDSRSRRAPAGAPDCNCAGWGCPGSTRPGTSTPRAATGEGTPSSPPAKWIVKVSCAFAPSRSGDSDGRIVAEVSVVVAAVAVAAAVGPASARATDAVHPSAPASATATSAARAVGRSWRARWIHCAGDSRAGPSCMAADRLSRESPPSDTEHPPLSFLSLLISAKCILGRVDVNYDPRAHRR